MKTPSQEQQSRKATEDFFADLLKPTVKPTKAAIAAKVWRETATKNILAHKGWEAILRIYTVTHQHCTTCNSDHTYTGVALIRHTSPARGDGLALEIPTALPEPLAIPTQVNHNYEETTYCATCIHMAATIDLVFTAATATQPQQLSLFN